MEIKSKEESLGWDRIERHLDSVENEDSIMRLNDIVYNQGKVGTVFDKGYETTDHAINQLFRKLGMPSRYFKNLHDKGFYDLVNEHIVFNKGRFKDKNIMLRKAKFHNRGKYENEVIRAILSDSYSPLDNKPLVKILQETLQNTNYKITYYKNNWKTMMLRILFSDKADTVEVEEGDVLQTGILVVNSEVGTAGVLIAPTVLRLVCSNGLTAWNTIENDRYYKRHVGLNRRKMLSFAQNAIISARKEALKRAKLLKNTSGQELPDDTTKQEMIEEILDTNNIKKNIIEQAQEVIEERYSDRNDMYSVVNSITRVARDLENTEDRLEVEKTVGDYIHKIAA